LYPFSHGCVPQEREEALDFLLRTHYENFKLKVEHTSINSFERISSLRVIDEIDKVENEAY